MASESIIITLALAAALAALIGLRWWMSQPKRVLAEIDALDLPADTKAAIRADCAEVAMHDTQEWRRDSPFLASAAAALDLSEEQLDTLFIAAKELQL